VSVYPTPSESGSNVADVPPAVAMPSRVRLRSEPFPALNDAEMERVVRSLTAGALTVSAAVPPEHVTGSEKPLFAGEPFCEYAVNVWPLLCTRRSMPKTFEPWVPVPSAAPLPPVTRYPVYGLLDVAGLTVTFIERVVAVEGTHEAGAGGRWRLVTVTESGEQPTSLQVRARKWRY
jgi:hypothetical protein